MIFFKKDKNIQAQNLLWISSTLVLLAAGWIFFVNPGLNQIKQANQKLILEDQRQKLLVDINKMRETLKEKNQRIFDETTRHSLVGEMTNLAKKYNIQVLSLEPVQKEAPLYDRIQLSVSLSGRFVPMVRFLKELETQEPPLRVLTMDVGEISRRSRQQGANSDLAVRLEIETLFRKNYAAV